MVEEVVFMHTEDSENSSDSSKSSSLIASETDCRRKKHFVGSKNKIQCRLRRRVRNRRFFSTMLRCISTSSSDSDDIFSAPDSNDTEDDSKESSYGCTSDITELSDYSTSHDRLLSSDSSTTTTATEEGSFSSSSSNSICEDSDSSQADSYITESRCNSSEYDTLSTDNDED